MAFLLYHKPKAYWKSFVMRIKMNHFQEFANVHKEFWLVLIIIEYYLFDGLEEK